MSRMGCAEAVYGWSSKQANNSLSEATAALAWLCESAFSVCKALRLYKLSIILCCIEACGCPPAAAALSSKRRREEVW